MGVMTSTTRHARGYRVWIDTPSNRPTTTICWCSVFGDAVRIAERLRRQKPDHLHLWGDA